MKIRHTAVALLLLSIAPLLAEDPPKPGADKAAATPAGADSSKEKEAEKPKWDVANPPYPFDVDVALDVDDGHLDDRRRLARTARRSSSTCWATSTRCRSRAARPRAITTGDPVGHAAALLAGRQADRLHLRPRGRRQRLGHGPRRQEPAAGDEGDVPPAQQPRLDARRRSSSPRASTSPPRARWAPGEIWLYHRTGGDGLQMTKRANEQKDVGEPAFSPDGRYLYYQPTRRRARSSSTTRTPTARSTSSSGSTARPARSSSYVTGAGGAIRPTPSPDGKSLAFVRRVRYKTTLFVRDLASGAERPSATASSATCRRPGRSTASIRPWPGRRTEVASCSGPAARSGASTWRRRTPR